jgi:hypothetical protein
MTGKFVYDPSVELKLARGAEMALTVAAYVEKSADGARRLGPSPKTHHYERSIGWAVGRDVTGILGRVFTTDIADHIVEFGSINNPAYAPLRNGVESTGLFVTDTGKKASP